MNKFRLYRLVPVLFVLMLVFACQSGGKAVYGGLGKASDPVPFMEKARTGTLPSGLKYYILENSKPEGRAFLTLAVNAGSVLETDEERGLAHFVEHMAFNGTGRFPGLELINYLRSLGMRFGPEVNAYTSFDSTVYGIETPVEARDGKKYIPDRALNIIDDWTRAVTFAPEAIDNERRVVIEEYRSRLGASERLRRQMQPLLFKGSPYAERLPIGLPEIIENAAPETITAFFEKWYRADNMAVIFAGDFDGAALEASLESHFLIAAPQTPLNRPQHDLAPPKKGSFDALIFTDPELPRSRVELFYKQKPEARRHDLASYRENLADYLAATMLYYRFEEASSKPETPYIRAGSGNARYGYSSGFYALVAEVKSEAVEAVLRELFTVKESLFRYGFTETEIELARRALLADIEQQAAEKDRQNSNSFVDSFTDHFIKAEPVPDIEWELKAVQALLPGIKLKEINRAVKKYFEEDDLLVFISAPESEKESLPSKEQIRSMALEYRKAKIARPSAARISGELINRLPIPGEIVSESADAETGALRWTLGNGMEVILKETSNRNNEVSLYAQARGGTLVVPPEMDVSASLAAEMLNVSGLGPYTHSELIKKLADKQVSFSFWASNFVRGFQGSAASTDLTTLFEMIHLSFTQPRLDPDAVQIMLENLKTRLSRQTEDPFSFFSRQAMRTVYGNSRFHPLESADIEKAKPEEALKFILSCLNPHDYTFVFTGNFDIKAMRSLVETYLASISEAAESFDKWNNVEYMRPRNIKREFRKGKEEKSAVLLVWHTPDAYTEEKSAAVSVLNEYLDIVLNDEIRENLGGVYSISAQVSLSTIPSGELYGQVYFVCDPRRAEELSAAVEAQIKAVTNGKIDAGVFDKSIEALIKAHEESVQKNLYISQSYANSAVIYQSPLSRLDRRPALYQAVTITDMQKTASWLLLGGEIKMFLYPE
ncbi:MAG: insulinase family protein [Treponema sp.]|nr:insulinase family protein [Treponema sp.]